MDGKVGITAYSLSCGDIVFFGSFGAYLIGKRGSG